MKSKVATTIVATLATLSLSTLPADATPSYAIPPSQEIHTTGFCSTPFFHLFCRQ